MSRDAHVQDLSWWIEVGARELRARVEKRRPVDLRTWSSAMRDLERERLAETLHSQGYGGSELEVEITKARQSADTLRWVWSTVVGNPFWGHQIRDLVRSPNGGDGPIELFPEGTLLVILLKPARQSGGDRSALMDWHNQCALVRLMEPLCLRIVKRGRLECAPVACDLWLFVEAGRDLKREVDRLRVRDETTVEASLEVEVFDRSRGTQERSRCIVVRAHSLNHAFGMASGRFESHRLSHGGRIYEHVFHLRDDRCVSLDRIRDAVELEGRTAEEAVRSATGYPVDVPVLQHLLHAVEGHPRYAPTLSVSIPEHRPSSSGNSIPETIGPAGISTDDIRKGTRVELRSGRVVEVLDDRRGNTRRVRGVEGDGQEPSDMYAWEFARVMIEPDQWHPVVPTSEQLALRERSDILGI